MFCRLNSKLEEGNNTKEEFIMKRRNEVVMSPTPDLTRSGKKRARMGGVDKTPEGPTPRKRKPVTRTRTTLRKYFTASKDKENKPDEVTCQW